MTETPMERARRTAERFLAVGNSWTHWLPRDGALRGGFALLGGVKMRPHYINGVPAWWELTEKETSQVVIVRPAGAQTPERRAS